MATESNWKCYSLALIFNGNPISKYIPNIASNIHIPEQDKIVLNIKEIKVTKEMGKALQAIRVAESTNTDIHGSSTLRNR